LQSDQRTAVRAAGRADAESIAAIYNHYVANTVVTFEEEVVSAAEMGRRIDDVGNSSLPWLVAEEAGRITGYAYATRWRARSAYRFSVEVTVYLAADHGGRGIGTKRCRTTQAWLFMRSSGCARLPSSRK
jgi:L-amino acid N-acyltransferase YncA